VGRRIREENVEKTGTSEVNKMLDRLRGGNARCSNSIQDARSFGGRKLKKAQKLKIRRKRPNWSNVLI